MDVLILLVKPAFQICSIDLICQQAEKCVVQAVYTKQIPESYII